MKKVYADKSIKIDYNAKFIPPDGFDDCDVNDPTSSSRKDTYNSKSTNDEPMEAVPTGDWR
jgi:hypothetical protein